MRASPGSFVRRGLVAGAAAFLVAGCGGLAAQPAPRSTPSVPSETASAAPTAAENIYIAQTAASIYRRAPTERLRGFLFEDGRGAGICVRAPAGAGAAADYTLLVLQRRLADGAISQVEDDVLVYRRAADAAPCRALGNDPRRWVRLR